MFTKLKFNLLVFVFDVVVDLSYKNVDEGPVYHRKGYKEKVTERSVHNLVVVQPVDWTLEVLETADRHGPRPKEMQN